MILTAMTRRTVFQLAGAAGALPPLSAQPAPLKGRLKQSAARWCYSKISLDDLAREGARIGLQGIDLIDYKEWPTVQKYGLVPAMTPGAGTIGDGFNRKENHDRLVREMEENIARAAAAKVPNVITFSGNRRGQADAEGLDNCVTGLNRVKKLAEDKGVTVCDKEWPTVQKYGLVPAMTPGAGTIGDGFNRKENHDRLVRAMFS